MDKGAKEEKCGGWWGRTEGKERYLWRDYKQRWLFPVFLVTMSCDVGTKNRPKVFQNTV